MSTSASPASGPSAIATATAQLSLTNGDGVRLASCSYRTAIRRQSVSSAVVAVAWHAAMAAWSWYGVVVPVRRRTPWSISSRCHRVRSCFSSGTRSPALSVRASARAWWSSISPSRPRTSVSVGISCSRSRPSRIASSASSRRPE